MRSVSDWRPYQHRAFEFVVGNRRCYLAAKAGAGKTAIGLALIDHVFDSFEADRALVVAACALALLLVGGLYSVLEINAKRRRIGAKDVAAA